MGEKVGGSDSVQAGPKPCSSSSVGLQAGGGNEPYALSLEYSTCQQSASSDTKHMPMACRCTHHPCSQRPSHVPSGCYTQEGTAVSHADGGLPAGDLHQGEGRGQADCAPQRGAAEGAACGHCGRPGAVRWHPPGVPETAQVPGARSLCLSLPLQSPSVCTFARLLA